MVATSRTSDTSPTAAEAFSRFCAGLRYDALPPVAVERVKHLFIDYIGIAMHASTLDNSAALASFRTGRNGA